MAFASWIQAVEALEEVVRPADPAVLDLAAAVGAQSKPSSERLLVVAQIWDAVAAVVDGKAPASATAAQTELLRATLTTPVTQELSRREADALIKVAIAAERMKALRLLRPQRGDRLVFAASTAHSGVGEIVTVSSIDRLGHVWTKCAGGYPARPQDLERVKP